MDTASVVVEPLPADVPMATAARAVSPAIVFDHVSLAFDDHVVLRELSFEIPAGALTILLGASGAALQAMFYTHLEYVTKQVDYRLKRDWHGEIRAYDDGLKHVLLIADMLAEGLVRQFPEKFRE